MSIFSFIGKIFKGIAKGIGKLLKGTVKVVKKVWSKIKKSKILKALAVAAAVVVTGGAAIGAFGGSFATSGFGSWMVGASQAITSFSPFGVPVGALFKPFAAVGKVIGGVAGGITDIVGLTQKAQRLGYKNIGTKAAPNWVWDTSKKFAEAGTPGGSLYPGAKPFDTSGRILANVKGSTDTMFGTGQIVDPLGKITTESVTSMSPIYDAAGVPLPGVIPPSEATKIPYKSILATSAIQTGISTAAGFATQGDADSGISTPLATESQDWLEALQAFSAEKGINVADIYNQMSFGTADPVYGLNAQLFSQQAFQPAPSYQSTV